MSPSWLSRDEVTEEMLEKEKEILLAQALNEGKPRQVAEKIVIGRIKKFYSENCLLEQPFVKDDSVTVGQFVENAAKELGGTLKISGFVRFEKGEGIEKRNDNFADEVAGMSK
jgi:elongation factor Ts